MEVGSEGIRSTSLIRMSATLGKQCVTALKNCMPRVMEPPIIIVVGGKKEEEELVCFDGRYRGENIQCRSQGNMDEKKEREIASVGED